MLASSFTVIGSLSSCTYCASAWVQPCYGESEAIALHVMSVNIWMSLCIYHCMAVFCVYLWLYNCIHDYALCICMTVWLYAWLCSVYIYGCMYVCHWVLGVQNIYRKYNWVVSRYRLQKKSLLRQQLFITNFFHVVHSSIVLQLNVLWFDNFVMYILLLLI